jgi:hypothetical protein
MFSPDSGVPGVLWLVIPEGNGKTTLTSGIALYFLEHYPNTLVSRPDLGPGRFTFVVAAELIPVGLEGYPRSPA